MHSKKKVYIWNDNISGKSDRIRSFQRAWNTSLFGLKHKVGQKSELNKVTWRSQFPPRTDERNFPACEPLFGRPSGVRAFLTRMVDEGWIGEDGRWLGVVTHGLGSDAVKRGVMWRWGWCGGWPVAGRVYGWDAWVIWRSPSWWRGWLGAPEDRTRGEPAGSEEFSPRWAHHPSNRRCGDATNQTQS